MKHTCIALYCALTLTLAASFSLLGCGGCADSRHVPAAPGTPPPVAAEDPASGRGEHAEDLRGIAVLPQEDTLSPEALGTYAFLVFTQALQAEDDSAMAAAAPLLVQTRLPANIWLEGCVWLVSRKSPHAVLVLEQALSVWPDDLSLNLLCAEALADQGQAQRGVQRMRDFLARHPDKTDARIELALLLVKIRQFDEAENLLNSVSGKQRTPLADYYHARALIGMDRKKEAIAHLQRAVKALPDFTEALAELAFLHEQTGNLKAAKAVYEKLLKLDFSPPDILLRLAHIALRMNQPEHALRLVRQGPNTTPFLLAATSMLMESRHYLQAESMLKEVESRSDAPDEVYLLLAELAYEQKRDLSQALAWLDKIPEAGKAAPRGALLRAHLLADAGKMTESLDHLRQASARQNATPELAEAEIRILASLKQMSQALDVARKAAERWPDSTETAFLLGSLLDETGDKKAAFAVMERLLVLKPDNHQALNYVGYTLAEENRDLDKALEFLLKADSLAPNQAYIVDSLAWAYFRLGRDDDALREIRRAVGLGGSPDPTIWEHYGEIAVRRGLVDEARRAYQKALELAPANAERLRQRLSELESAPRSAPPSR